ncbi:MAG: hypothetical protein FJ271_32115 [Planctomycetes bacterium]|nr:hypothetical protein [Planctomycetota bacterium]
MPSNFHFAAFRPTRDDEDGISVFRERIISAAEVASLGRKPEEYFVVRLSVAALAQLGLSVVPDVDAKAPAGHAFIPELGLTKYQRNKQSLKDVLLELARMAANSIVHVPRVPQ